SDDRRRRVRRGAEVRVRAEVLAQVRFRDVGAFRVVPIKRTNVPESHHYRSIYRDFDVWGWSFHVEREPVEFLNLTDVTCNGITLRGTGTVTVTVPASCATGNNGSAMFVVDLGLSFPIDEPA